VRTFVLAILVVAAIGRLSASSRGAANEAYYSSSADAWALRGRTLATVEHVVALTHPTAIGAAHSTHVHLPGGGYLCAWVATRSKSEASRPAVWASRRDAIEDASLETGDMRTKEKKQPWSDPFVLARAPGAPATHRDPALFFVSGVLHLHFRVGDEDDAAPHVATSADGGATWSRVVSLRGENEGKISSDDASGEADGSRRAVYDACVVGGTLPRKPGMETVVTCVGGIIKTDAAAADAADAAGDKKRNRSAVTVLVSENGERFRVASTVSVPEKPVVSAAMWRHSEASVAARGKHVLSMLLLDAEGSLYRAESDDSGGTWSEPSRLHETGSDSYADSASRVGDRRSNAAVSGGVAVVAAGRRSVVMARVFYDDSREEGFAVGDARRRFADARVRLRLSDDGGLTWPMWRDVSIPGGCERGVSEGSERAECGAPVLEPWPNKEDGFTLTYGVGGGGGILFSATSVRAFRETANGRVGAG
jgi:hypothetical protein